MISVLYFFRPLVYVKSVPIIQKQLLKENMSKMGQGPEIEQNEFDCACSECCFHIYSSRVLLSI